MVQTMNFCFTDAEETIEDHGDFTTGLAEPVPYKKFTKSQAFKKRD